VPVAVPFWLAPRNPRSVPEPDSRTVCPAATTLSGVPAGTFGQVNVVPPTVTWDPGVSACGVPAASACAEKLSPTPS
jgi:hypothetical protein